MRAPSNITNRAVSSDQEVFELLRLTLTEGIGPTLVKKMVSYLGGAASVYKVSKRDFIGVDGLGEVHYRQLHKTDVRPLAHDVLECCLASGHHVLSYMDSRYPQRLKNCLDAPAVLYFDGVLESLNPARNVSIVGTRNSTRYGEEFTERFVDELVKKEVHINSGLAYGIDGCSHKSALKSGGVTVGVVAHGLDRISPALHRELAERMKAEGGILTEHRPGVKVEKGHFPMRNRIVAGMSDAVVIIESDKRGGSLITAQMANDYNRDVFALPGRWDDRFSRGCNTLIQKNQAHILNDISEFMRMMSWDDAQEKPKNQQIPLFVELNPQEKQVFSLLSREPMMVDRICNEANLPMSTVSATLLQLEFQGLIKALPGKQYVSLRT